MSKMDDAEKILFKESRDNKYGTFMSENYSNECNIKLSLIKQHNQITSIEQGDTPAFRKTMRIVSQLSEFFPDTHLISFAEFIHSSFKPSLSKTNKKIPVYKFHFESDRALLLLAFISLVLQKQDLRIEETTITQINERTEYSINSNQINRWRKKIRANHPKLYNFFTAKSSFGPNPKEMIACLLNKITKLTDDQINKENLFLIRRRSLEICKEFTKSPQFKKTKSFTTLCYAIIALAYTNVTGKDGIPFDEPRSKLRYISARRTFLRKIVHSS